jgi:multiple sugar transport system permease protein
LALPLYLLFAKVGIVGTYWSVLIPSFVSPFGVYLCRIYGEAAGPDDLIDSARIDGAGELRIFATFGLRIMSPAPRDRSSSSSSESGTTTSCRW